MLGRVIRFVTLAAVAGSVAQLPATVASAEELAPRTVLVQPADMPLSRDGLSGLAASVAGTDVAEVLSGALKAASGQRIVGGAVTPQDAATALSRLPSSPYTDRIMYAANGSLMVLDFLSEATVFRARMATISLPDGVASILGTASAVAEGSGIALTAQGPDGTTQYSSVVAAGDNECKIHCFGASLTISILTGVVCFILFPTPAGAAAALVCGLALAVAGTAFNEVCPRFAAI